MIDEEGMGFFLLPETALQNLYEEIHDVVGDEMTPSVLFRFGFRIGREMFKVLAPETAGTNNTEVFRSVWAEGGLGDILSIDEKDDRVLMVNVGRSPEAGPNGCNLLRGMLSGFSTGLFGENLYATEESCAGGRADEGCMIRLSRVE